MWLVWSIGISRRIRGHIDRALKLPKEGFYGWAYLKSPYLDVLMCGIIIGSEMETITNIPSCDSIVEEYLIYRGFTKTFKHLQKEKFTDRLQNFHATKIVEQIFFYIHSYEMESFINLWYLPPLFTSSPLSFPLTLLPPHRPFPP